ncbi:MAG: cation diffusion facilitator family transporter [Candidatus Magnetoovum sp. WYHC-5]|nr:cation diffusion facilitator family transporter [Candidatus Magnetoovum sp. WYHC-5]
MKMKYPQCKRCGEWSPRLAFIGNLSISIFKFFVGISSGSKGLVADAVHSVADATSSLFILIALKIAKKPKDITHPFGHGKIEYISTIMASIFIFVCATTIFIDALSSFKGEVHTIPKNSAIFATIIALIYSYLMYSSNTCAGTQLNSPALVADASESKADALASIAVLAGLIGTKLGFYYADTVAASMVSLFVFHISVEMFLKGVNGLIDVSIDSETMEKIVTLCKRIDGVEDIKSIRSRSMGQRWLIDINIDVDKKQSVLNVHVISEHVRALIMEKIEGVEDVFVHPAPVHKWRIW